MVSGGVLLLLAPVLGRLQFAREQAPTPVDANTFSVYANAVGHGHVVMAIGFAAGIVIAVISAHSYLRLGRLPPARQTEAPHAGNPH